MREISSLLARWGRECQSWEQGLDLTTSISSHTTVVAMKFTLRIEVEDGEEILLPAVIIASEGQVSSWRIEGTDFEKVHRIDDQLALGCSGSCFLTKKVIDFFESILEELDDTADSFNFSLALRSKRNFLGKMMESIPVWLARNVSFLLVGYDPRENRCRIFHLNGVDRGFALEAKSYSGIGSGHEVVMGLLGQAADQVYSQDKITGVIRDILATACKHDPFSSGTMRAIIITPFKAQEVILNGKED